MKIDKELSVVDNLQDWLTDQRKQIDDFVADLEPLPEGKVYDVKVSDIVEDGDEYVMNFTFEVIDKENYEN